MNERVSASTENAPVYNMIQQKIQMTQENFQLLKYKICSSNDGGQSTIFQLLKY